MSLLNAYNQIIQESSKDHEVKGAVKKGQDFIPNFKVNKQDGPKVDSPKEDKEHSVDGKNNGEAKKLAKEATNPFDILYKKVLAQENWEAEEEANEQPNFSSPDQPNNLEFSGDTDTGEGEIDLEDSEEEEDPMKQVLSALRSAVEALERVVGPEEEEMEDEDDFEEDDSEEDDSEEDDSEDESFDDSSEEDNSDRSFGESTDSTDEDEDEDEDEKVEEEVDAQVLGHALIDLEKLAASLTSPKSQVVKGAVPVAKGKAQVPKGTKTESKPTELKGKGESLQSKKTDTGYVKKDKNWYDQ